MIFRFQRISLLGWFAVAWLWAASIQPAAAAATGTVQGRITETGGTPLFGANIEITSRSGERFGTTASSDGSFRLELLPPGAYQLLVSFVGYRTSRATDIQIVAGEVSTHEVMLVQMLLQGQEIVVSASRRAENILDAPASITKVSAQEISRSAGANTFVGTLKTTRGVSYTQVGLFNERANSRGYGTSLFSRMLLVVDDRNPTWFGNFFGRTTILQDIESVEVIAGTESATYGPDAVSGVVTIRSKDPRAYPGTAVSVGGGTRNQLRGQVRHAGAEGNWGWKVAGEVRRGKDFDTANTFYNADSTASVSDAVDLNSILLGGQAGLFYYPDDRSVLRFSVGARYMDNIIGFVNTGRSQLKDAHTNFQQFVYKTPGVFVNVYRIQNDLGGTFALHTRARNLLAGLPESEALQRAGLPQKDTHLLAEARVIHEVSRTGTRMHLGIDYRHDDVDSGFLGLFTQQFYGSYGYVAQPITDRLSTSLALRLDVPDGFDRQLSPKAAVIYKPRETTALRATFSRAYRSPNSVNQRLEIQVAPGVTARGNGSGYRFGTLTGDPLPSQFTDGIEPIAPEVGSTLEVGLKSLVGHRTYLDFALFRSVYKSFISPLRPIGDIANGVVILDAAGNPIQEFTLTYVNFGKQTAIGFDAGIDFHPTDGIKVQANVSVVDAGELSDASGATVPFNTPRVSVGLGFSATDLFRSGAYLDLSIRHVDGYDYEEGVHVGPIPTFTILDLSFGFRSGNGITYKLSAQNVFDNDHIEIPDGARIGQILTGELEYAF